MFALQTVFGRKDKVFDLLQASSEAAHEAAQAVNQLAHDGSDGAALMATFTAARRREKELAAQISEELVDTFVTSLDREDIEAMNSALYRIPKTVEKFAERYVLVRDRLDGVDFRKRTDILATCTGVLVAMVHEMHNGLRIAPMRKLQDQGLREVVWVILPDFTAPAACR